MANLSLLGARLRRGVVGCVVLATLLLLGACATPAPTRPASRPPAEVHAQLVSLLPASLDDRAGWAVDIQSAFQLLGIPTSSENLCAVLAVTEQESSFQAHPLVPGLARIAREEIDRRAAKLKIPKLLVRTALALESPDGRSWEQRLATVRTEHQLSLLFEEFIAKVPLGQRLFADANPVRTGGAMQVSIAFAERHAREHGYPHAGEASIRREVFSRRGGMYFGIAHLLGYRNSYSRHLYRYADFNAGWYASRNAAFQNAVTVASGVPLALDGDLILHGKNRIGATEAAARSLSPQLGISPASIRKALEQGDRFEFENSAVYTGVFALAERATGKPLARAVMPDIALVSPKITRKLTTEWFATRVEERYRRCINKAFAA